MLTMVRTFKDIRGLTLIELMVVLCIILILSAVAVPTFTSYRTQATIASVTATVESMRTAMANHSAASETGLFPVVELGDGEAGWGGLVSFMGANGTPLKAKMREQGIQDFVYVPMEVGGVIGADYLFVFQTVGVSPTKQGALVEIRAGGINRFTGSL